MFEKKLWKIKVFKKYIWYIKNDSETYNTNWKIIKIINGINELISCKSVSFIYNTVWINFKSQLQK